MPLVLTIDGALAIGTVGLVRDGVELARIAVADSPAANLPPAAELLLRQAPAPLEMVAVVVGPGSFTGLRAAIALAHGLAIGAGVPVVGVAMAEALTHGAPAGRELWTAIDTKRGSVYLARPGALETVALDALPSPHGPVAVAGDAAQAVAARLAASGADALALDRPAPTPAGIAAAAVSGRTYAPLPLYVEPPLTRPGPASRPPPR